MTIPLEREPIELHVYAVQDSNTGIWTIDIPEWHIYGARRGGSRDEAIAQVLNAEDLSGFVLRVADLSGADLDYSG